MNLADDLVVDDPFEFVIFLNGNSMQISSGLEVILGYFCFTEFSVLELSRDDFTKFSVLELFLLFLFHRVWRA